MGLRCVEWRFLPLDAAPFIDDMKSLMCPFFATLLRISLVVVGLLSGGLLACEGDTTGPVDRRIGSEGGTAVLADGQVRLSIPPGALSEGVWFSVLPAVSVPSSDLLVAGSSWEIGPPGTAFSRPVTLTIAYGPGDLPVEVGEDGLGVFRVAGGNWAPVRSTWPSPGDHAVSGLVTTLGRFGVIGFSVDSVAVSPPSALLPPGGSVLLNATPLASDGRPLSSRSITWTSSKPDVAAVNASGLVTGVAEGEVTITAASGGRNSAASVSIRTPVATVDISPDHGVLNPGQALQLAATPRDVHGNALAGRGVNWASSAPDVAAVDSKGRVTAVAVGSASISATVGGQRGAATIGVHSSLSVSTIGLAEGVVGQAYHQSLAARGGDGTYLWSISAGQLPPGFSLDGSTGEIRGTPTASGTTAFTVQVESAGMVATQSLSILVKPIPVASVEVHPASVSLVPSQTGQLTAVARDASGSIVPGQPVWASTDQGVVSVNAAGMVTARTVGSATVTATVGERVGWAAVIVSDVLSVLDSPLAMGVVGRAYTHALTAVGGDGHFSWEVMAGNLPAGLDLNAGTGMISGTPLAQGTTSFIVKVTGGDGQTATRSLSLVVHDEVSLLTSSLEDGVVGNAYSETLAAAGGQGPYAWSLASDTLPTGLTLAPSTGVIAGIPLFEGVVGFTVQVASVDGQTATKALAIEVARVPAASVDVSPSSATVALGETRPLTATVRDGSGNLLQGRTVQWASSDVSVATVDTNGLVTARAVGSATVSATVDEATAAAAITVHAPLEILTTSLTPGVVGLPYSQALAARGGDGTYAWTLTAGTLPAGLSLDGATGVISGTPVKAGGSMFLVQVVSGGQTVSAVLSITVG